MLPISMDSNLARKLDKGMKTGETVDLSFPVVYAWALNGQNTYKSQGGALYYGGWAAKVEDVHAVTNQQGIEIPTGWKGVTIPARDGGEFDAYTTRSLIVAPFGKRISWLYDGKRSVDYVEGGRRHVQVLAYLAHAKGEGEARQIIPWGPVVLTAKGYQARGLMDAFKAWEKATAQVRYKVAPGVPAWCFYMSIGTYGKERIAMNVGKPGAQSPITPLISYIPGQLTEEFFSGLFVGQDVAEHMGELLEQSQDWLNAWKKGGEEGGEQEVFSGEPEAPASWPPEETPF